MYFVLSEYEQIFIGKRMIKDQKYTVALLHIFKKTTPLLQLIERVHENNTEIDCICVMTVENNYDSLLSHIVSHLYSLIRDQPLVLHPSFELCLPQSGLTLDPQNIPVVTSDERDWQQVKNICVLPGWEFYGLDWILHRWEVQLGNFDHHSFLCNPVYPKDLYNSLVPPSIVQRYMALWVQEHGWDKFRHYFYGLSCFYKDELGQNILEFFYEQTQQVSHNRLLYRKLHSLFHKTDVNHPYRKSIFFYNSSLTDSKRFHIGMFICQYLSYEGMFCCSEFLDTYMASIVRAFRTKFKMLVFQMNHWTTEVVESTLRTSFKKMDNSSIFPLMWIGRESLQNLVDDQFLKFLYSNWYDLDRNIYLWDLKGIRFRDSQHQVGGQLTYLYSTKHIHNFNNPNFRLSLK